MSFRPQGEPSQVAGPGATPFWLDNETYGYIRYQLQMELVAATVNEGSERVLLDSVMVTAVLNDSETGFPSISFVAPPPTIPNLLFLAGPEIRGTTGKYNIFSFQVADDWLKTPTGQAAGTLILRLQLDESPLGYPSRLTPPSSISRGVGSGWLWWMTASFASSPRLPTTNASFSTNLRKVISLPGSTKIAKIFDTHEPFYVWHPVCPM